MHVEVINSDIYMSEKTDIVVEKEVTDDLAGSPQPEESAVVKTEEEIKLEARKAELEEQVSGLEGTVSSLKEDIVRKRQERKGVEGEEQQPVLDKEALLAELDEKLEARLQPVLKENENLRKAVLKSNEESLKAKKQALNSINARIASVTASKASQSVSTEAEEEVELDAKEKKLADMFGLKNPRYLKEVEIL